MASKKQPSIDDALSYFKDVMKRSNIIEFKHVNSMIHAVNAKDVSVIIVPDQLLWNAIIEDEELKSHMDELDISKPENSIIQEKFTYAQDLNGNSWIEINGETMYAGEMVNITIDGFKYEIPVNKGLFPTRLKKAEYNNFAYRIYTQPRLALVLKKKFEGPIENTSFSIIRAFQVL